MPYAVCKKNSTDLVNRIYTWKWTDVFSVGTEPSDELGLGIIVSVFTLVVPGFKFFQQ